MIISVPDHFGALLSKALARGSRSTVLNPLAWFFGICASASITSFSLKAPGLLGTMFGVFAGISGMFYLFFYAYYAFKGKDDCLRSERFTIQKMAIERGLVGDDLAGLFRLPEKLKSLPPSQGQEGNK
jgi:hypothetical protein